MEAVRNFLGNPGPAAVALLSAFIALLSVLVVLGIAVATARRDRMRQRLDFIGTRQRYFENVRHWADELSDLLSEAIHLCELDPARIADEGFFTRRHQIKVRLSSLIDRGRWFFPNLRSDESRPGGAGRFRGYRHAVLDSLVAAYGLVVRIDYTLKEPNKPINRRSWSRPR